MKLLGLIGYPLSHSFSPAYFRKKFEKGQISGWDYRLFPIREVHEILKLVKTEPDLQGLNVTIPHKRAVMPYLQHISPAAAAVGAVNTIYIERKGVEISLHGFNTDVTGFRKSLQPLLNENHTAALVLGSGGASRAVTYVLKELHIPFLIVSRTKGSTNLTYDELDRNIIEQHPLIINTTPLGMHPEEGTYPPLPYEHLSSHHLLYDLVYNPAETLFLKKGMQHGATVKNGLEMLELQAEAAWDIWNSF